MAVMAVSHATGSSLPTATDTHATYTNFNFLLLRCEKQLQIGRQVLCGKCTSMETLSGGDSSATDSKISPNGAPQHANERLNGNGETTNACERIPCDEDGDEVSNMKLESVPLESSDNNEMIKGILDHVQNCSAVFKNQQLGDPDLTKEDKRSVAQNLLNKNPFGFLDRFAPYLRECHFEFFTSYDNRELAQYAMQLKMNYHHNNKKLQQKNRRYEALKRLEAQGSYFSEAEMEKREPLLYHQLVGQYLNEKEKLVRHRQNNANVIPTFSNFLIDKMERDEITALMKSQQEAEDNFIDEVSEDDSSESAAPAPAPRWGDDWVDAEMAQKEKNKKKIKRKPKKVQLSAKEKSLLLQEFKTLMHSKFLNGLDPEFNYDDVDLNPEYDCLQAWSQDVEDKYFDEESCDGNTCTDTGIEDY